MQLYLVVADDVSEPERLGVDRFVVRPDVMLVVTDQTRSRLYHEIKRQQSGDSGLLVCPVDGAPKFRNMNKGALAWLREAEECYF